ncbi:MAG: PilN domain-containing protein [Thiohalocapsa sp.]|jgi:type IV pilus assembly protein PilN|nr:PilN domain-containing protein [Thiohalocapsa sp.]MCF7988902.1 PilN domain-containing protein [Thiohalocapsa sp.]
MAKINLLPWRDEARQRQQRALAIGAAAAMAMVVLLGLGSKLQLDHMIKGQSARNATLEREIKALDARIKRIDELEETKAGLLSRMQVIQELQESRPEIVHLFDELVDAIPDGVFLTGVTQTGGKVVVEGGAQSNARVSAFMRNIDASPWIGNPQLLLIENKDQTQTGLSHFRLGFDQRSAAKDDMPFGAS